eukprot:UN08277
MKVDGSSRVGGVIDELHMLGLEQLYVKVKPLLAIKSKAELWRITDSELVHEQNMGTPDLARWREKIKYPHETWQGVLYEKGT